MVYCVPLAGAVPDDAPRGLLSPAGDPVRDERQCQEVTSQARLGIRCAHAVPLGGGSAFLRVAHETAYVWEARRTPVAPFQGGAAPKGLWRAHRRVALRSVPGCQHATHSVQD